MLMLARGLAERGLTVGMIVLGSGTDLPESVHGVRILPHGRRRPSRGPLARVSLATGALKSMLRLRTQVLVHMNAGPTTGIAALAGRLRGARFIYSSASVVDFEFETLEQRGLNVRLYEWGVRNASEVVVQTTEQAELCRARFQREPRVIPSIASRAEPRTEPPEAFLWVGRVQPLKRPDAYVELARALPDAKFWLIAVPQIDESADLRLTVEVAERELPNLELLEPRPREAIGELLARTVAVVNTSEQEGLPNIFLEGWSRGVPALALSFDPDELITGQRLGLFARGDPVRFEEQARTLWRQRNDQAELASRCIAYVRDNHDEAAVTEHWLETVRSFP
jgi:glycosyltransferase involved in cell wall biosynthesis